MQKVFLCFLTICCIVSSGNAAICPNNSTLKAVPFVLAEYNASDTIRYGCPAGYTEVYNITKQSAPSVISHTLGACILFNAGPCWLFIPEDETAQDDSGEFTISGGFCPYKY